MMNKIFLFVIPIIFLLSLISAQEEDVTIDLGVYKSSAELNLLMDCSNNGTSCSGTAQCNVSRLQYPNGTQFMTNRIMGNTSFYPSWNLTIPIREVMGKYQGRQVCCQSGNCGDVAFSFEVTQSGDVLDTSDSIIYIFLLLLEVLIFVFFLWGSLRIPFGNFKNIDNQIVQINWSKYAKLLFIVMTYVTFLWITWTSYNILNGYATIQPLANYFFYLFRLFFTLLKPFLVVTAIFCVVKIIMDNTLLKTLEKELMFKSNE